MKKYCETDYYYMFVLGYDLLQNHLKQQKENECDLTFEKVKQIYEQFLNSEENKRYNTSTYDNLVEFLKNNKYL